MTEYKLALVGFGGVNRALAQLIAERNQQWKTELGFTLKIVGVTDLFLGSVMNRHGLDAASLARLPASKGAMAQLPGGTVDALNEAVIKDCGADIIAEATFTNPVDGEPATSFCRWSPPTKAPSPCTAPNSKPWPSATTSPSNTKARS